MEKEIIGKCPKCGSNIYEAYSYYCSSYKEGCTFNLKKSVKYYNQFLNIDKNNAKKLIAGNNAKLKVISKEGQPYFTDFVLDIKENEVSVKKFIPKKEIVFDSNTKYYVHSKYGIKLDGLTTDIHIGKGAKGFITRKLKNIKITSFKAASPYVNLKSIIENLNLGEDVQKIFVISSDEVNDDYENKLRIKNNREFLEGITYYTDIIYGNGKKIHEQHFENNLDIYPFKYSSFANDADIQKPNYFNLHSKFYLINDEYAFLGSANLTEKGLSNNFETLFFIDKKISENNKKLIEELIYFFDKVTKEKYIEKENEIFNFIETNTEEISNVNNIPNTKNTLNTQNENSNKIYIESYLLSKIKSFFKF